MQKSQKNERLDIPVENLCLVLQIPVNPVFKEKKIHKIPFVCPNKILTSFLASALRFAVPFVLLL